MADDDAPETDNTVTSSTPSVAIGYSTQGGWVAGFPGESEAVQVAVGEPADMRKVKAPVDDQPIDLARADAPLATEVTVITGEAG